MKQLKRVKVEVWLTESQMKELKRMADNLGIAKATFARRAINHAVGGGTGWCLDLRTSRYD